MLEVGNEPTLSLKLTYCIIWKVSPLPKVSPLLPCISNGKVCRRDPLFESKPPGLLSRLYSIVACQGPRGFQRTLFVIIIIARD